MNQKNAILFLKSPLFLFLSEDDITSLEQRVRYSSGVIGEARTRLVLEVVRRDVADDCGS